jgi:hypothetical protein
MIFLFPCIAVRLVLEMLQQNFIYEFKQLLIFNFAIDKVEMVLCLGVI